MFRAFDMSTLPLSDFSVTIFIVNCSTHHHPFLFSRFFINLPTEELASFDRVFFQLQEANWFYSGSASNTLVHIPTDRHGETEKRYCPCPCLRDCDSTVVAIPQISDFFPLDFYSDKYPHLPKMDKLKTFCRNFFAHSAPLKPYLARFDDLFSQFRDYVGKVPVCGCVLMTPDLKKCLLVRSWKGNSWCFPKGKINKDESEIDCAAREVLEEVGFDVSSIISEKDYVQTYIHQKRMRLYIVPGVSEKTVFNTFTRKEIGEIRWFSLNELGTGANTQNHKFFTVAPVVSSIHRWVRNQKKPRAKKNAGAPAPAPVATASKSPKKATRRGSGGKGEEVNYRDPERDALTFGSIGKGKGSGGSGWSAEEMFKTNERKFGVCSTVPPSDTILDATEQLKFEDQLARLGLGHLAGKKGTAGTKNKKKEKKVAKETTQQKKNHNILPEVDTNASGGPSFDFKFDTASILMSFSSPPTQTTGVH